MDNKPRSDSWKHCVALESQGWVVSKCERIDTETTNDLAMVWSKKGEQDITIMLAFSEQCLWIEYLRRKHNV